MQKYQKTLKRKTQETNYYIKKQLIAIEIKTIRKQTIKEKSKK